MTRLRDLPLAEVAAALFALGLFAGAVCDPAVHRVQATRGGYRVLESDFHAHTRFSDGLLSPFDLVLQGKRRGLDVLGVTEHNNTFPAWMARWFSPRVGGPTILIGEEVTTDKYHLIAVGLRHRLDASRPLEEVLDDVEQQGAVSIAAHPVKRFWPRLVPLVDRLRGAEVMHPMAYGTAARGWAWGQMRDFHDDALAKGHRLLAIGSSDYHFGSPLGVVRTLVFARDDTPEGVLEALREGRTVVHDLEGRAYGDPAMVALLEREPYALRPQDYGYAGEGPLDRTGRTLGFLGLVGLVLFRRDGHRGRR